MFDDFDTQIQSDELPSDYSDFLGYMIYETDGNDDEVDEDEMLNI